MPYSKITDKSLWIAHLQTAYKANSYEYHAGVRDLSLEAKVGIMTVSNGTHRIIKETGNLSVLKKGKGLSATFYKLNMRTKLYTHIR